MSSEPQAWGQQRQFVAAGAQGAQIAALEGQPTRIVQVDAGARDFRPRLYTVQLGRENNASAAGNGLPVNCAFRARVNYGGGGVNRSVECDWLNGGTLQLLAWSVSVEAIPYNPNPASAFDATGLFCDLSVVVGYDGATAIAPTYSVQLNAIAAAGGMSSLAPLPTMARAVSMLPTYPADVTLDPYLTSALEFVRFDGSVLCRVPGDALAGGAASPIPNDVRVRVVNLHATEALDAALVFHLAV